MAAKQRRSARRAKSLRAGDRGGPLPDLLVPGLTLLFVGINPGLISAAAGHYYANPRNTFWRLLHEARLIPVPLKPEEDYRLPEFGLGLTDIVKRASRGAADLKQSEFNANRRRIRLLVERWRPKAICFNGKTAFEGCFGKGSCVRLGPQTVKLEGAPVFVLPSTSPANAAVSFAIKKKFFILLQRWLARSITQRSKRPPSDRF